MPVDFEMILSASPPLFSHSAFTDFHYHHHHQKLSATLNSLNGFHQNVTAQMHPVRSCLMVKDDAVGGGEDPTDESSANRAIKKRVCFADDKGLSLTHVRIMTEPSDCPPRWTDEFLEQVTRGIKAHVTSNHKWEPLFPQPASDYLEFRKKLDKQHVSLENVIIKEEDELVTGTIKVKNISFGKEVFVRATFDRWHSFQDFPATYVPSGLEGTSYYDTFSFTVTIPPSAVKFQMVEFCVCFRCEGDEHWDNNGGSNYRLVAANRKSSLPVHRQQFTDAFKADFSSWAEFASWSHLVTEGPYW